MDVEQRTRLLLVVVDTRLHFRTALVEERQAVVVIEIVGEQRRLVQRARREERTFLDEMAEHLRAKHIRVELRVRRVTRMKKAVEFEEHGSIGRQLIGPTENGPKVLLVAGQTHAHEAKEDVTYACFHLSFHLNHLDA